MAGGPEKSVVFSSGHGFPMRIASGRARKNTERQSLAGALERLFEGLPATYRTSIDMIRTFIAIELDEPARQKIAELISRLKTSQSDVKWITENQMHFTLKFLGNISEQKISEISDALKSIAGKFSAFNIHISGIGAFPNLNRPRVIWLGIDKGADEVKKLNNLIETYLEKLEFAREKREFKPHLTLGRVRSLKNIHTLTNLLKEINFDSGGDIRIKELILFQSTLTPKGAIYTQLFTMPLIAGEV